MLAAPAGMETWARTVRVAAQASLAQKSWTELCRAEWCVPLLWYLTIIVGEIEAPVTILARIRSGNGLTTWVEQAKLQATESNMRITEGFLPARCVEVDVMVISESVISAIPITGSLAPIVLSRAT